MEHCPTTTLLQGALSLLVLVILLYQKTVNSALTQETSNTSSLGFFNPKFQILPNSFHKFQRPKNHGQFYHNNNPSSWYQFSV